MQASMTTPGVQLQELLRGENAEVLLVAPFIKENVLRRLLEFLASSARVIVVTRWRPDEVAAGVSDLQVFDLLQSHAGARLRLCPRLHAKYYRAGTRILVGSANLTSVALGWSSTSNLELLIDVSDVPCDWTLVERQFLQESVPATREIRDLIESAAAKLSLPKSISHDPYALSSESIGAQQHVAEPSSTSTWLPYARQPNQLFSLYSGETDHLSTEGRRQGAIDLIALEVPTGLTYQEFILYVRSQLIQMPLVQLVDEFASEPRRFGAIRELISAYLDQRSTVRNPEETWQTLMRWLLFFFSDRYQVKRPRHSELFSRK